MRKGKQHTAVIISPDSTRIAKIPFPASRVYFLINQSICSHFWVCLGRISLACCPLGPIEDGYWEKYHFSGLLLVGRFSISERMFRNLLELESPV